VLEELVVATTKPARPESELDSLRIGTLNVSSLNGNELLVVRLAEHHHLDVLAVQETRYDQNKRFAGLPQNWQWLGLERPRDPASTSNNRGGGIGFLYRRDLRLKKLPESVGGITDHCERMWLAVARVNQQRPLFLGCVYCRPVSEFKGDALLADVRILNDIGEVIIMGDFNARFEDGMRGGRPETLNSLVVEPLKFKSANMARTPTHFSTIAAPSEIDYILASPGVDFEAAFTGDGIIKLDHVLLAARVFVPPLRNPAPLPRLRPDHFQDPNCVKQYTELMQGALDRIELEKLSASLSLERANFLLEELHAALFSAGSKSFGVIKNSTAKCAKNSWWNTECEELRADVLAKCKELRAHARSTRSWPIPSPHSLSLACDGEEMMCLLKKAMAKAKLEHFNSELEKIDSANSAAVPKSLWIRQRALHKPHAQSIPVAPDVLRGFWEKIWSASKSVPENKAADDLQRILGAPHDAEADYGPLCVPFTAGEVEMAIMALAKGKTGDFKGLCAELLQLAPRKSLVKLLVSIFNAFWLLRGADVQCPDVWRDGITFFIPKKVDDAIKLLRPENYRPISVGSVTFKLFETVLRSRLAPWFESHAPAVQYGFREKRSTLQLAFQVIIGKEWAEQRKGGNGAPFVAIELDVAKAFDSMSHPIAIKILIDLGLPSPLARMILATLCGHRNHLAVASDVVFDVHRGALQGSVLAPFLFGIYMKGIAEASQKAARIDAPARSKGVMRASPVEPSFFYADDMTVLGPSPSVQCQLDAIGSASSERDLKMNVAKCGAMPIGAQRHQKAPPTLTLYGCSLPIKLALNCVGVSIPAKLNSMVYLPLTKERKARAMEALGALAHFRAHSPLRNSYLLGLFVGSVVPGFSYGSALASMGPEHQLLQNIGLRTVTGSYQRAHLVDLHRFTGQWRVVAKSSRSRLLFISNMLLLDESNGSRHVMLEAARLGLPWWERARELAESLRLGDALDELVLDARMASRHDDIMCEQRVRQWRGRVTAAIGAGEALWCGALSPMRPHALLCTRYGHIAFLFTCASFNPADVTEKGGEKPCWLCKTARADSPRHMLLECADVRLAPILDTIPTLHRQQLKLLTADAPFYVDVTTALVYARALHTAYQLRREARDGEVREQ
jgi:hypothetical protein